jgi:hypothetical protein
MSWIETGNNFSPGMTAVRNPPSGGSGGNILFQADWTGANGQQTYTEQSPSALVATFNGDAQLQTSQFVSAPSSVICHPLANDYLTFPYHASYDRLFDGSDWNIITQFRPVSVAVGGQRTVLNIWSATASLRNLNFRVSHAAGGVGTAQLLYYTAAGTLRSLTAWGPNFTYSAAWCKLELQLRGSVFELFIDDVSRGTVDETANFPMRAHQGSGLTVGATVSAPPSAGLLGYLDDTLIEIVP